MGKRINPNLDFLFECSAVLDVSVEELISDKEIADPEFQSTGDRLRWFRIKADLTQTDLAKFAGISGNMVCYLEAGVRSATPDILLRLANALHRKAEELIQPPCLPIVYDGTLNLESAA